MFQNHQFSAIRGGIFKKIKYLLKSENFSKSFLLHIGKNKSKFDNFFFGYDDALKIYGAPKLCMYCYVVK